MIKIKIEKTKFMSGIGFYISKKTWNIKDDHTWFGPSLALHLYNKIIRVCWVIAE